MSNIEKSKSELSKKTRPHPEWKRGDILLDIDDSDSPELLKIAKLTKKKIFWYRWCHYTDGTEGWDDSPSSYSWEDFEQYHKCIKLEKNWEEYKKDTLKDVQDFDQLERSLGINQVSTETALAETGDKDMLTAAKSELERRQNKVEIMRAVLQDNVNALTSIVQNFRSQIAKVERVIGVVELYLGVHEEIYQIQSGEPTEPNMPISIRQQLLFMDEEVGDPKDGGLDAWSIEGFDRWVCKPENLQRVLPEKKAIVALRVRRKKKDYQLNDPWVEAVLNAENMKTYFLIRNGDNLYRIWTNVNVYPRLFPTREELNSVPDPEESFYSHKLEELEKRDFNYKKFGLFLQGILHRTQIFQPLSELIHVFKSESWNGMLNFIRDDESLLPTGRLSWREWRKEINSKIQVGSRIIYKDSYHYSEKNFMRNRTNDMYGEWVSRPGTGLYEVVEAQTEADSKKTYRNYRFKFLYNPDDEVYKGHDYFGNYIGYEKRKKRIGIWIYADECLNYDQMNLEDIEFYINSRTERGNYLDMMPLLYNLRRMRKEELEREKLFVQLVINRNKVSEEEVWSLVEWWKFKNKWKRPIDKDDAKALRMIERKLKRKKKN